LAPGALRFPPYAARRMGHPAKPRSLKRQGRSHMTEDALRIDAAKTAFNAHAKAVMRAYLKSRTWPEKIASIERMNEAARLAREGMRRTRERKAGTSEQTS